MDNVIGFIRNTDIFDAIYFFKTFLIGVLGTKTDNKNVFQRGSNVT